VGGGESIALLEGSQASPTRPSDKSSTSSTSTKYEDENFRVVRSKSLGQRQRNSDQFMVK
jgi:hypothetical protein